MKITKTLAKSWIRFNCILYIYLLSHTNLIYAQDTTKPWTYWWWMGSAVNQEDIALQLEEFAEAGLGGVHIIPIYGVKGYEKEFIPFLSEGWLDMVAFTVEKAKELSLGVDLTLGTGWPFGGPMVNEEMAAKRLVVPENEMVFKNVDRIKLNINSLKKRYELSDISAIYAKGEFVKGSPEYIQLYSSQKPADSIMQKMPKGSWEILIYGVKPTGQKVKRAAPGGEGLVVDYFSKESIQAYLNAFEETLTKRKIDIRAYYNDSYEVYGANWSSELESQFQQLHGYVVQDYLFLLSDTLNPLRPYFLRDVRATVSDKLLSGFTETWASWSNEKGKLTRNQAHGSPGNILDYYAKVDIPETESFGCSNFAILGLECDPDYEEERFGRPSPLMMKFASSPAHLLGKRLVSSETATWLGNHFKVSLKQVKPQIDELFTAGINHIFYHGSTYTPEKEGFPGWLFYASTNFNKQSHFWEELPHLNRYIQNVQTELQNSQSDHKLLLYFPIDDLWTKYEGKLEVQLDVHKYSKWFNDTVFGATASKLWDSGYGFDYISDRQLESLSVDANGHVYSEDGIAYKVIVVPPIEFLNITTLKVFGRLAKEGATIIFEKQLPTYEAGLLKKIENKRGDNYENIKSELLGNKNIIVANNLISALTQNQIEYEIIKQKGLDFIKKKKGQSSLYFITNLGNQFYKDSIQLSANYQFIALYDPLNGQRGFIQTNSQFYLDLPPGKSIIIETHQTKPELPPWPHLKSTDNINLNEQKWNVQFKGGISESLFESFEVDRLTSWTQWDSEQLQTYCGKASYQTLFEFDTYQLGKPVKINFSNIHESAKVIVNGQDCGTVWSYPLSLIIPADVLQERNKLEIVVQNLSANYMRKYDSERPDWRKFYDINFVDITYKPFKAADWDLVDSGIVGKVFLEIYR